MRFDADADAICSLEMRFARWRCGFCKMRLDAVAAPAMEKARTVVERSWSRLVRRLLCIRPLPAPVPQALCLLIGTCDSRGYHWSISGVYYRGIASLYDRGIASLFHQSITEVSQCQPTIHWSTISLDNHQTITQV